MIGRKRLKMHIVKAIFGCFFAMIGLFGGLLGNGFNQPVYADEEQTITTEAQVDETNSTEAESTEERRQVTEEDLNQTKNQAKKDCKKSLGEIGWLVCPATGKVAEAVDWLYDKIDDLLVINPISTADDSPVYQIWKVALSITNVIFIIFLLVVIYSQITGLGINNYGIKKILPKLIVAAILVNLSFLICLGLVDLSNIIGGALRGLFSSIGEAALPATEMVYTASGDYTREMKLSYANMYGDLAGGAAIAIGGGVIAFETGSIWMLIPVLLGALVSVVTGLITIALRQAVVILLIMVSPLAIVSYILPNTENLYKKWWTLLKQMLVFYPMFSLLFGASNLAGYAIITSAKDGFGLIIGMAVQIFPLFYAWKMMKMSGTFLSTINAKLNGYMAGPLATNRTWAMSRKMQTRTNTLANGISPSAKLMQFMEKRRALREEDTRNLQEIASARTTEYVQRKIADSEIGDETSRSNRTSRYTRHAKAARTSSLTAKNVTAHAEHTLDNYSKYFNHGLEDRRLSKESEGAWMDYGRSLYLKEIDDENDIGFLINRYLSANKRDENNRPIDEVAFRRYISSVAGPDGEERLYGKIIAQAAKVESKQRSEIAIMHAKVGHNGYNKKEFRSFITGYRVDDDGWAVDENGKRLKDENGNDIEVVQGDALTKAPDKLTLYDKRDAYGLYYDVKDQRGNIVARVHRGIGDDGRSHEDSSYIKETLANYDIPISDPINNIYGILSGIQPGEIITPQGRNDIGLSKYSTTIGRAMSAYKGDASWAGAMFNAGIGNQQIRNSAQYAIWVLDSITKTLKPGAFNTQNPASVKLIRTILDPNNWDKIFTEQDIMNAMNINNKEFGGENWLRNEDGTVMRHENGAICYETVENPNYEQRMNTLKRKLLFPAMSKVLPAFDRLRTSNTADNQKPGTADEQYKFLKMVQDRWENNPNIDFDPTLVNQDLPFEARAFRRRKHDEHGNMVYATNDETTENLLNALEDAFGRSMTSEELIERMAAIMGGDRFNRALGRFEELRDMNPNATMDEIHDWFDELASYM